MLKEIIKKLIDSNHTEGLSEKLDVFYMAGKISREEYEEFIDALNPKTRSKGKK